MMETNGMFSTITTSGLLGVIDSPLHQQQQQQQQQNLPNQQQNPHLLHHSQVVSYAHDTDTHQQQQQQQLHQSMKHGYPPFSSSKNKIQQQQQQQSSQVSDEDEPNFPTEESSGDPKRKISPWQRMKWTDTMVRLLIMAVYYIGDEAGSEGTDPNKKKGSSGLLQKKGKWKSVSRAMMEKGFYVSPQQCEDKFNDLNKRYKRVNDILGKGTACRVVENQNLLDTMDLTSKMKDEVRKLLNSKHLFFREMCAYHNSCGHGGAAGGSGSNVHHQVEGGTTTTTTTTPPQNQPQHHQQQQQQQHCFHSSENGVGNLGGSRGEGLRMLKIGSGDVEEEDDEDEDDESEDYSDEDGDESGEGVSKGHQIISHLNDQDEEENDRKSSRKRPRKGGFSFSMSPSLTLMHQMNNEISGVFQDGGKSPWEKKQWIRNRILQLEEQKIRYESQAFELEKQRLKWQRYSSKKEREMERAKLENERKRLENERMVLLIRKKEIELMNLQQQQQQQQHSST
ncbi:sequence-specific DNA binding transcription factor [Trifolium repens]|nr:sequence-specific DNA binding transcription factor [Trifolium repens]